MVPSRCDLQKLQGRVLLTPHDRHWYALNGTLWGTPDWACLVACPLSEVTSFVVDSSRSRKVVIRVFVYGASLEEKLQEPPLPWDPAYLKSLFSEQGFSVETQISSESSASLASDTPPEAKFYRVVCPEDRIQFPDWVPYVDQFPQFRVWTPMQGTIQVRVLQDGVQVYSNTTPVAADGQFVVNGQYNPNNWPNDGYYNCQEWELQVTVTSPASLDGEASTATATVKKVQRRRPWLSRRGVCVQQDPTKLIGANIYAANSVEWDNATDFWFKSCWNGAMQFYLGGAIKDASAQGFETLFTRFDWNALKAMLGGLKTLTNTSNVALFLSDMHYVGHGGPNGIGFGLSNSTVGQQLTASSLRRMMTNQNMFYVGLDGCNTSETPGLLSAFMAGLTTIRDRNDCIVKGIDPQFAWGFNDKVNIAYWRQGLLFDKHYDLISDFYIELTRRDPFNGYMLRTFKDAMLWAKNGGASGTENTEGEGLTWIGCEECFFDEL